MIKLPVFNRTLNAKVRGAAVLKGNASLLTHVIINIL